jgi:uncharacterized protein YjbI with pentapeptide repeats
MLRSGNINEFNRFHARGEVNPDFTGMSFRGSDLRGLDAEGLDFSNSKFKQADLRGINFTKSKLAGASIYGAKISGCLFPDEFDAPEVTLSLQFGTRLRERIK